MADSPVTPPQIKATLPSSTGTLCSNFVKALLQFPVLIYQLIAWMFDEDGNVSVAFKSTVVQPGDLIFSAAALFSSDDRLLCDGSEVNRTDYPALFAAIGVTWGTPSTGDVFKLPDFRARFPVGVGAFPSATALALGDTGGEEKHELTDEEAGLVLSHVHVTGRQKAASGGDDNNFCLVKTTAVTEDTLPCVVPSIASSGTSTETLGDQTGAYFATGPAADPLTNEPAEFTEHNNLPPYVACYIYIHV